MEGNQEMISEVAILIKKSYIIWLQEKTFPIKLLNLQSIEIDIKRLNSIY